MRKVIWAALCVVGLAAVGFFFVAPPIVDGSMNRLDKRRALPSVSAQARAVREKLVAADLHTDTLLFDRNLLADGDRGHVSLPRLERGRFGLVVFSSVTRSPTDQNYESNPSNTDQITLLTIANRQPPATWTSLLQRSLHHAAKLREFERRSQGRLAVVTSKAELASVLARRARGETVTAGLLSIEGLHNLEGRLENLDRLYDAGFRMSSLTHFFDNELAGSAHGAAKGELTPLGRQVVARMQERGMIVDVAHVSVTATDEVLRMATAPVISSHGGVKATCDATRNLADAQIRGIAATGGLVGIGLWTDANCDPDQLRGFAQAVRHVRDLVGVEHVALGADWDGAIDAQALPQESDAIIQALLNEGLTEDEILAVLGGNTLRLLQRLLPDQ